jgi:branched-subunit amino acid aminotransferase/4-amino-4-deoxychorismate lyase
MLDAMAEMNGRPVALDELQTLALTNYGHFTSFRVDDGRVRGLSLHLDRLVRDCQALFAVDLDPARVRALIAHGAPAAGSVTVRVTVFDPATDLGQPSGANDPQVLVTQRAAGALPLPPLNVQTVAYVRDLPEVKNIGLFGTLHRRRAAQLAGFDDALFTDHTGLICEGGTWNIGFFDGHDVIWPDATCLPGITMKLLQLAFPHKIKPVSVEDLPSMEFAFATNAAIGVRALTTIDDIEYPSAGGIIDELREAYLRIDGEEI